MSEKRENKNATQTVYDVGAEAEIWQTNRKRIATNPQVETGVWVREIAVKK
ncbi:hypothetical protein K0M31_001032 [Melipona bicolor]|uniref:Uncharacterized protein n=1 Tax=Melipona bicolor TaxID=60889 RepID=A0AA40GEQ3_9HYME|nr:hypothetical protein K0M31_001032 [Melipona bicolor]